MDTRWRRILSDLALNLELIVIPSTSTILPTCMLCNHICLMMQTL